MKKNKQKIIIFLSVLLLITLFPFSVFATGDTFYLEVPYSTEYTVSAIQNNGVSYGEGCSIIQSTVQSDVSTYMFYVPTETKLYVVTNSNITYYYTCLRNSSSYDWYSLVTSNIDTDSDLYYWGLPINSYTLPKLNVLEFNSFQDGIDAINNVNSPVKYPYTFQNGYLFVYDLGQSSAMYSFDLQSKSEEYSNIGSIPFPDTNQCYWFDNSLPEIDETTIPSSSAITIDWSKGSKTNIFGQTQDMVATISGTSSGRYLYVYNPPVHYKWSGSSNPTASEVVNYPVTIDGVSSGDNFYIYDSYARLSDFNQGGKVTGTITGTTGYGSVSTDGAISVVTSEGAIFNQTSGGSTDISGANGGSLAENINGLKETLDNFLSQFVQLLSAPISHIRQLISASHEFLSEFSHFFDWLPSEVSGFVISAFVVMVAIGIFKLFL